MSCHCQQLQPLGKGAMLCLSKTVPRASKYFMIRPGLFTVGWQLCSVQTCCFIMHWLNLFVKHFACGDKASKTLAMVEFYLLNYGSLFCSFQNTEHRWISTALKFYKK